MDGGFTVNWDQDGNSYAVNTLQAESNVEKFCTTTGGPTPTGGLGWIVAPRYAQSALRVGDYAQAHWHGLCREFRHAYHTLRPRYLTMASVVGVVSGVDASEARGGPVLLDPRVARGRVAPANSATSVE